MSRNKPTDQKILRNHPFFSSLHRLMADKKLSLKSICMPPGDRIVMRVSFIIGLKGESIQCIPLHEKSSAGNHRKKDAISIEVCGLDSNEVIRRYDIKRKQYPHFL